MHTGLQVTPVTICGLMGKSLQLFVSEIEMKDFRINCNGNRKSPGRNNKKPSFR